MWDVNGGLDLNWIAFRLNNCIYIDDTVLYYFDGDVNFKFYLNGTMTCSGIESEDALHSITKQLDCSLEFIRYLSIHIELTHECNFHTIKTIIRDSIIHEPHMSYIKWRPHPDVVVLFYKTKIRIQSKDKLHVYEKELKLLKQYLDNSR